MRNERSRTRENPARRDDKQNRMSGLAQSCDTNAHRDRATMEARMPHATADRKPPGPRHAIRIRTISLRVRCKLASYHRRFPVREMERFPLKQGLCGAIEAVGRSEF